MKTIPIHPSRCAHIRGTGNVDTSLTLRCSGKRAADEMERQDEQPTEVENIILPNTFIERMEASSSSRSLTLLPLLDKLGETNRPAETPSGTITRKPTADPVPIHTEFRKALRDHFPATRGQIESMIKRIKYTKTSIDILLGLDDGKTKSVLYGDRRGIPKNYSDALKEFRDSSHEVYIYSTCKTFKNEQSALQSLHKQLMQKIPSTVEEFRELRGFGSNFLDAHFRFRSGESRNYILRTDKKPLSREKIEKIKKFCESFKEPRIHA